MYKPTTDPTAHTLDDMRTDGYAAFPRVLPDRAWFEQTYRLFDGFIGELTDERVDELRASALEWLACGDNTSYFCGVPPSFRDREGVTGKRNKAYLQWCLEFARSPQFAATEIAKKSVTRELSQCLEQIESICARLFMQTLLEIGAAHPHYLATYSSDRPLPIIIKMIRYNNSPRRFATDPHYDKSALSLILNADDDEVQWRLGRGHNCPLSSMTAPIQYPEDPREPNSCVMIPGLCLQAADVDLPPTPHFVMSVETNAYRHSIVAFLLAPHLQSTDTMNTQAPYIHDVMRNIR